MSTENVTEVAARGLVALAERINAEHRACEASARRAIEHACEAGRLLLEAKALCHHGEWGGWLSEHFAGSERTAQLYMRVARGWPELEEKAQRVADLSLGEAARILADPRGRAPADAWRMGRLAEAAALAEEANAEPLPGDPAALMAIVAAAGDLQNEAAEYRIRVERKVGELLRADAWGAVERKGGARWGDS